MPIGNRKTRVGRVIRNRMDKTVVVAVERRQPHPIYRKNVKRVTNFHAHDEENRCSVGDWVAIAETRPLSKTKRWRVAEILSSGDLPLTGEVAGLVRDEAPAAAVATEPDTEVDAAEEADAPAEEPAEEAEAEEEETPEEAEQ